MADTSFRENVRGIVALAVCNLLFVINDSLIKLASAGMPLSEILFFRGAFVTLLLVPLVVVTGAHKQAALIRDWPLFWRTVAEIFAAVTFLLALFQIPIANANVIAQIVPLMITAAGAILFGEVVGVRRWSAIVVGFIGVLIVVRPGLEGFNSYSLLALASAFFITLRDITTRLMPRGLPATLVALVTGVAVGLSGPFVGLLLSETWVVPEARSLWLIGAAVFFLTGGYLASVEFMRHGDIAVVAPFRYTAIIWAIAMGYLVWGEVPDWAMLLGTAIIAGSGIYTFRRERNLARLREEAAAGEGI